MKTFLKFILWVAILGGAVYGGFMLMTIGGRPIVERRSGKRRAKNRRLCQIRREFDETNRHGVRKKPSGEFHRERRRRNPIGWFEFVRCGLFRSGVRPNANSGEPAFRNYSRADQLRFQCSMPPATIVIKMNEPLSFSVNSGQVYKIDWGDGLKDQGAAETGKTIIVSHIWKNEGDYKVNVSVGNSVSTNIYSFPVRVYQ